MKKFFLLPAAAFLAGTMLCAAEFPPEGPHDRPQIAERGEQRNPMMQNNRHRGQQQMCPMMKKGNRRECGLVPCAPMNEDEMARFALLRLALRDAQEDYRADASEKNLDALRKALDQLVTAGQQFEIERCEKALARAKAAVARKDQIVTRQLRKLTAKPEPKHPAPMPPAPGK